MAKKQSEWKQLQHRLTLAGLILSLLVNCVQGYFMYKSDKRGDKEEALRKEQEVRTDRLLQDKEKWVNELKAQLLQVNQKIEADSIGIDRTEKEYGDPLVNGDDIDDKLYKYKSDKEKQEKRRLDLTDEISYMNHQ